MLKPAHAIGESFLARFTFGIRRPQEHPWRKHEQFPCGDWPPRAIAQREKEGLPQTASEPARWLPDCADGLADGCLQVEISHLLPRPRRNLRRTLTVGATAIRRVSFSRHRASGGV